MKERHFVPREIGFIEKVSFVETGPCRFNRFLKQLMQTSIGIDRPDLGILLIVQTLRGLGEPITKNDRLSAARYPTNQPGFSIEFEIGQPLLFLGKDWLHSLSSIELIAHATRCFLLVACYSLRRNRCLEPFRLAWLSLAWLSPNKTLVVFQKEACGHVLFQRTKIRFLHLATTCKNNHRFPCPTKCNVDKPFPFGNLPRSTSSINGIKNDDVRFRALLTMDR